MQQSMGAMEGSVNILAWPGYAEDGWNDPKVDWVTPFEQQTGCKANVKYFPTSDDAVNLMRTGDYDVVSASGDASLRLIASGDVAPVNTKLIKDYSQIEPFLKDRAWNSVNGQMYGMPHGWGANLLMYRTDDVTPAPTSWASVFTDSSTYHGKVTAYDSPIYIADAALFLMKTQPDLGIKNPYALDQDQLAAAVDPAEEPAHQHRGVLVATTSRRCRRSRPATRSSARPGRSSSRRRPARRLPVKAILPERGRDRLVGHLDDQLEGQAPELRLRVDDLHHRAEAAVAGRASTSARHRPTAKACQLTGDRTYCEDLPRRRTRPTPTRSGTGPRRSRSASTVAPTRSAPTTRLDPGLDRDQGLRSWRSRLPEPHPPPGPGGGRS